MPSEKILELRFEVVDPSRYDATIFQRAHPIVTAIVLERERSDWIVRDASGNWPYVGKGTTLLLAVVDYLRQHVDPNTIM